MTSFEWKTLIEYCTLKIEHCTFFEMTNDQF